MDVPKLHVLTILSIKTTPITQETLVDIAETVGFEDTPQSLRSRLVELERAGYARRVDRHGISRRNRTCWRWQLTEKGKERTQGLLDHDIPNERK